MGGHTFFKIANSKTPAWVGIGFIGWFFFVNYYMIHYRNFHSEMEHGDEDWLDPVKASRELMDSDDKYNRILSENVKVSIRGKLSNNNMMIIGSSGSFKTTSIMHQNLLQMGSSYVVLDVKGDTQRKLGKIFENMVIRYSRLTSKTRSSRTGTIHLSGFRQKRTC